MDHKPRAFQHPECFARALGGCSQKISGEHYVSKSLLELVENRAGKISKSVRVEGLAFQKPGILQSIGVASLVGNILCEAHNSCLSPLDVAGTGLFTALDRLNDAAGEPTLPDQVLHVDGDRLERWMLKTLCGGLYAGAFGLLQGESMKGECPPVEWLEILYQDAEFPACQGIYYMPSEKVTADPVVFRVAPLLATEHNVVIGFQIWFFGFHFVLLLARLTPGVPTLLDTAAYRPAGLRAVGSNTRIRFDWRSTTGQEIVFQAVT